MTESTAGAEPLKAVRVGMTGSTQGTVTFELTVGGHVPGMPPVYGTPMMIMAMEMASGLAIAGRLPPGWVTVGSEVDHPAPRADPRRAHGDCDSDGA
jgi:predicted thioesterase